MTVHCTSIKNYEEKHYFKKPKFNLELFKTLILNFAYIHSKRRKIDMFILFQKCQFVCPNKINSPPIRQFSSVSIFGHVTIIKRQGTRKPQDLLFVLGLLARDTANHLYAQNIPLTHAINPCYSVFRSALNFLFQL